MKVSVLALLLGLSLTAMAQDEGGFDVSVDLVSRYVWRGADFGSSPAIQPSISYTAGGFSLGAWGSASTNNDSGADEADLFASYSFSTGTDLVLTDYFFPGYAVDYFYAQNHFLEIGLSQSIKNFYISANYMFANANDDLYFEAGFEKGMVAVFLGAGNEAYTPDGDFNVCNVGMTVSKEIPLSETFALPLFGSLIINPAAEGIHLVVGISL